MMKTCRKRLMSPAGIIRIGLVPATEPVFTDRITAGRPFASSLRVLIAMAHRSFGKQDEEPHPFSLPARAAVVKVQVGQPRAGRPRPVAPPDRLRHRRR